MNAQDTSIYDVDEALDRLRAQGIDLAREAENPRVAYEDVCYEIKADRCRVGFSYDQFVLALNKLVDLDSRDPINPTRGGDSPGNDHCSCVGVCSL